MTDNQDFRDFESRLLFLDDIFRHKFSSEDIMRHCIQYKLDMSYISYLNEIGVYENNLISEDPVKILNKIKKGE